MSMMRHPGLPFLLLLLVAYAAVDSLGIWFSVHDPELLGKLTCRIRPLVGLSSPVIPRRSLDLIAMQCSGHKISEPTFSLILLMTKVAFTILYVPAVLTMVFLLSTTFKDQRDLFFERVRKHGGFAPFVRTLMFQAGLFWVSLFIGFFYLSLSVPFQIYDTTIMQKAAEDLVCVWLFICWGGLVLSIFFSLLFLVDTRRKSAV